MQRNLAILFLGILICACSASKINGKQLRYFDENNIEISKSKFSRGLTSRKYLTTEGDSTHHKKLTARQKQGQISSFTAFKTLLNNATNQNLNLSKPIVIIYFSGKDDCNSSGTTNKEWIKNWYEQLEEGLYQVGEVKPIYIFKENKGLDKYKGLLDLSKDPEGIIERLFFEHHYPCSSFVAISKNGEYMSYLGEFSKELVWEATQLMNK